MTKPITHYCDAAEPLARHLGDRLERLNREQKADFAEAIARKLGGKSVPFPWSDYLRNWKREDLVALLRAVAECLE